MSRAVYPWRPSSVLLLVSGVLVAGIGIFFIFFRPALLPEDIKYTGLSPEQVALLGPAFQSWLRRVFTVLGGFAMATGILSIGLAATSFRGRSRVALFAALGGGACSIGLMAAVNFMIASDYKWALLGVATLWSASILCFLMEGRGARNKDR